MSLRAVIFDVDGVLVQSMERHHEAYRRAFAELRVEIRREEVFANEGRRSREVIEALAKARGIRLSPDELEQMNKKKQETFFSFGPMPYYPGVPELLAKVKAAGLGLAAVTGTSRLNVENHFGVMAKRFDVIVTADDVTHTKPHPEPYLSAFQKLQLRATDVVVVENATLGVKSAKAAGSRVIAVTSTLPKTALAEADFIAPTIAETWPIIEGLRK